MARTPYNPAGAFFGTLHEDGDGGGERPASIINVLRAAAGRTIQALILKAIASARGRAGPLLLRHGGEPPNLCLVKAEPQGHAPSVVWICLKEQGSLPQL